MSLDSAANLISKLFKNELGQNPAKIPNDAEQITDLFHLWSREAFD